MSSVRNRSNSSSVDKNKLFSDSIIIPYPDKSSDFPGRYDLKPLYKAFPALILCTLEPAPRGEQNRENIACIQIPHVLVPKISLISKPMRAH